MSDKLKYMFDGEYIIECSSCGCEAPVIQSDERYLCQLCYGSFIGNATQYPRQYENVSLFVSIAQVGNMILDELTDRRLKKTISHDISDKGEEIRDDS